MHLHRIPDAHDSASALQEPLFVGVASQRGLPQFNGKILGLGVGAAIAVALAAALLIVRQGAIVTHHFQEAVATPGTDEEIGEYDDVYDPGSDWPLPETHWNSWDAAQKLRAALDGLEARATALEKEKESNSDPERAEQIGSRLKRCTKKLLNYGWMATRLNTRAKRRTFGVL